MARRRLDTLREDVGLVLQSHIHYTVDLEPDDWHASITCKHQARSWMLAIL